MNSKILSIGLVLCLSFSVHGIGAAQEKTIPLAEPIKERYDPHKLPVAGADLMGIGTSESNVTVGEKLPKAYIPAKLSGRLCLSIASRDGTYSATAEYTLNNPAPGVYALQFQSKYLPSFKIKDLGSLLEVKSGCSSATPPIRTMLPVFWDGSTPNFPLHILLQADEGDARVRASATNAPAAVECSQINTAGSKAVFDEECFIPSTWKGFLTQPIEVDISIFGDYQPPIRMFLSVP